MKIEKIEKIKKRFHREWLLIALDKIDESTTTPISGRLIAHSPHRDEIYSKLLKLSKLRKILVEYSEDSFPKGYAAAFYSTSHIKINNNICFVGIFSSRIIPPKP